MTAKSNKSLCLVDGSGYIFRAFYALPMMTRPDGTPVNAVYGFLNMLMNLVSENRCSHIVVVFDAKRKNFRNDIFSAYKENRKETPPELVPQFPLIRQASEVLNIPWIELEGYEADDLIATYAKIASDQGWCTTVVSADKDLMQLMNDHVSLYDPMKKKIITNEDVLNKFGVLPDKVTDVQSLMGDSTDNIPGATGIGPKTAAALINEFGSLENLLANIPDIKNEKRRMILERDKDQILISQKLVTLDNQAPVSSDLSIFKAKEPQIEKIEPFLIENNFKSLLAKISNWSVSRTNDIVEIKKRETVEKKYSLVQTKEELNTWIQRINQQQLFAIDTETTSLNTQEAKIVGISLATEEGLACYIPLRHGKKEEQSNDLFSFNQPIKKHENQLDVNYVLNELSPLLKNANIKKIGHNIKYDMHILANEYQNQPFEIQNIEDTMVLSYVLNGVEHGHGMDELASIYLDYTTIKYQDVCGSGKDKITFDEVELDKALDYAAEDADITLRLYHNLYKKLNNPDLKKIYSDIEIPLVQILFEMERAGIKVDCNHLSTLKIFFAQEINRLTTQIYELAGEEFNINSPAQLGNILFEKMGLQGGKKGSKGTYSTDVKVLESLAEEGHEIAKTMLEYRSVSKLKSTYVDALLGLTDKQSRVHTSYMQTVTSTGRLSSTDPNLQNIPIKNQAGKEIRKAFIAKPGYKLVAADYSQIELRLMADVADIKNLKQSFLNNEDIHTRTAAQIFNTPIDEVSADLRRQAKAINFGIIYGMSAFGLSNQLGISRTEAGKYIEAYLKEYPEIKEYMDKTTNFAVQHGYVLTPFKRKCFIRGITDPKTKGLASRAAINAPIQGGAADIIKMAMIKVIKELKKSTLDATLLLQVHDELVLEVKDEHVNEIKNLLKNAMENVVQLSVPLVVEVGVADNWKDAH